MRKGPKSWLLLILLAVILIGLFLILISSANNTKRTPDFIGFYTAGKILRQGNGRNLYSFSLQRKVEREFLPKGKFFPLDHPPFEAWLCLPLSFLSYRQAYLLWGIFNIVLLVGVFWLLPWTGHRLKGESILAWIAVWFLPVAEAIAVGQDSIFLALVFLLAFLALKKRRDFSAGLALGAGLYRFEIVLPFTFIFFLRRRSRVLAGFFAACVVCFLASLAVVGWGGLHNYIEVLLAVGRTGGSHANGVFLSMMPSLRAALVILLGGRITSLDLFLTVLAGTVLLLGWAAWQLDNISRPEDRSFDLEFSLAVIAALLASYHIYAHELTPLIVVAFVVLGYERESSRARGLGVAKSISLLLLCFLMLLGGGLTVHRVSLLFFVLLGLCLWLSLEITSLRRHTTRPADGGDEEEAPGLI